MKRSAKPRTLSSKIKTPAELGRLLKRLHRNQEVVFTNGCFDLLHKGHVTYLQAARGQGDLLVVALNSDASVRKLKGQDRPLVTLADRLEVMASLEAVDYVTWFPQDTPLTLINLLHPHVLVKGGDWKAGQIVGGKEVQSWGGKVKSLRFIKGRSTTRLIQRMKKSV